MLTTMKTQYITPSIHVFHVEVQNALMQYSTAISNKEIDAANAGLVKDGGTTSSSSYNVWNDDWSE